ncbi:hypothetical protein OPQ81_004062 [Rhizoctonia solani]|nr:hypothetical protein OPQ81_004062 [Rhizoctonia solani]
MSTYGYAIASGYLSPYPTMGPTHHSTHEDMDSYEYRRRDGASIRSYHSSSNYPRSAHSVDERSTYSYNAKSEITTFDERSVYSHDTRPARSTCERSSYEPDTRSRYSYEAQSARSDARSTYSVDVRSVRSTDAKTPTTTISERPSRTCVLPFSFSRGSHRSRVAPSLTHSAPSTLSDEDNESDAGHPVSGLNTPYTAKVSLWRDAVHDVCNDLPPETIIPPHLKARYEYGRRQYETSPSLTSNDTPSIVVPSYTAPSGVPSPRSTSPPYPLCTPPEVHVSDLGHVIDEIEAIEYEVNSRILGFTFPSSLDLGERCEKSPNGEPLPLPYTGRNKPLIEHRHYLDKSLLRMDEIQSFNDSRIKGARKRVVTKIQEQIEQLNRMEKMVRDNMHYERWKKTPRIHVTAPPATT